MYTHQIVSQNVFIPQLHVFMQLWMLTFKINFMSNPPALNLWMNTIPSFSKLVSFLFVPVKVKVSFIVCFEHAITYNTGFLQLVLKVMENLSLFIDFWAP